MRAPQSILGTVEKESLAAEQMTAMRWDKWPPHPRPSQHLGPHPIEATTRRLDIRRGQTKDYRGSLIRISDVLVPLLTEDQVFSFPSKNTNLKQQLWMGSKP